MLGPAKEEVVMVSLGPAEVVMIVKTLDMMLAESSQSLRRDNKVDDIDEPRHSGLITEIEGWCRCAEVARAVC